MLHLLHNLQKGGGIMSKKNVHKKPKKNWLPTAVDTHHIFYTKVSWNSVTTNRLRSHWYCIVEIPKGTLHHRIHEAVRYVPVPRDITIMAAIEQLTVLEDYGAIRPDDSFEKRLRILIRLFDSTDQPTANALKKQLDIVC